MGKKQKQHKHKHPRLVRREKHRGKHHPVVVRADGVIAPDESAKTTYTAAEIAAMPKRAWRLLVAERLGMLEPPAVDG